MTLARGNTQINYWLPGGSGSGFGTSSATFPVVPSVIFLFPLVSSLNHFSVHIHVCVLV